MNAPTMSLRVRAVLITGLALLILWTAAAAWMLRDLQTGLNRTLDDRLAMSAQMVSGLLQRTALTPNRPQTHWADIIRVSSADGIACEIRSTQGKVLAQTEGGPYSTTDALPVGYSTREIDGQRWRLFMLEDTHGYQIMTADRLDQRHTFRNALLRAAGIPFLIAMMGGLVALWLGIGRGLLPLQALSRTLRKRRADDTAPIIQKPAPRELDPVIHALNELLARLARALTSQRAFTDAAAHELRSPLTAIDTHLQVARLTEGDAAQRALASAEQGVRRLHHTLEQMMVLARTEDTAGAPEQTAAPVAQLQHVIAQLPPDLRARVRAHWPDDEHACALPAYMLETAVRNLLDNALRYSPPGTPVTLRLRFDAQAAHIIIQDEGPGLSPQQTEHIGQRFWRGDQGRRSGEGAGLGISIVRAIGARFGGELTFTTRAEGGLCARLQVPRR